MSRPRVAVVVWGNCQAAPLARLLAAPLAARGLEVADVPPVFEVDAAGLARVRDLLSRAAAFITHPIRDEYRVPGCGSQQLAALLPAGGRTVRVASCYDRGPYPWQVTAHDGAGLRIAAPMTDYHDLRVLAAAGRGDSDWDVPAPGGALAAIADAALEELRAREREVDVPVSHLLRGSGGMYTVNHPANAVLAAVARDVLAALELSAPGGATGPADQTGRPERVERVEQVEQVVPPEREFLGSTRTPREAPVVAALGGTDDTDGDVRETWTLAGRSVSRQTVAEVHLAWYAAHPDVVADARVRYADRFAALGLTAG